MGNKIASSYDYFADTTNNELITELSLLAQYEKDFYLPEISFYDFLVIFNKRLLLNSERIKKRDFINFLEFLKFQSQNVMKFITFLDFKDFTYESKNKLTQVYYNCDRIKYFYFVLKPATISDSNTHYDKVNIL